MTEHREPFYTFFTSIAVVTHSFFCSQVLLGRPLRGSGRCRPVHGSPGPAAAVRGGAFAAARPAAAVRVQDVALASRHARVRGSGHATGVPAAAAAAAAWQPDH